MAIAHNPHARRGAPQAFTFNRRCFLRHPCDWKSAPGDFQDAGATPQNPDKLVRYPRYTACTTHLAQALQALRRGRTDDPLVTDWTSDELRSVVHDYLRSRNRRTRTLPAV